MKQRTKLTPEQIYAIIETYRANHSIKKTAVEYGYGQGTIKRLLINNNVATYTVKEYYKQFGNNFDEHGERIIDLYTNQNKSRKEIGKLFNIDPREVSNFLRKNKVKTHIVNHQPHLKANKEKVIEIYNKHKTLKAVAEFFKCDEMTISLFLKREGICHRKYQGHNTYKFTEEDKQNIQKMINEKHMTTREIAVIYGCTAPKIQAFCNKNNIIRPSHKEQARANGCKSVDSFYNRKEYRLPSGDIIHLQGYEPQFLDYVFSHKLLNESEIVYKVPKIRYTDNLRQRYYFPDFYIPRLNLIVEIKSLWVLERQTAINITLKQQATIKSGFDYILILDNDFTVFTSKYFKEYNES